MITTQQQYNTFLNRARDMLLALFTKEDAAEFAEASLIGLKERLIPDSATALNFFKWAPPLPPQPVDTHLVDMAWKAAIEDLKARCLATS